jgi:hypothetical protein
MVTSLYTTRPTSGGLSSNRASQIKPTTSTTSSPLTRTFSLREKRATPQTSTGYGSAARQAYMLRKQVTTAKTTNPNPSASSSNFSRLSVNTSSFRRDPADLDRDEDYHQVSDTNELLDETNDTSRVNSSLSSSSFVSSL